MNKSGISLAVASLSCLISTEAFSSVVLEVDLRSIETSFAPNLVSEHRRPMSPFSAFNETIDLGINPPAFQVSSFSETGFVVSSKSSIDAVMHSYRTDLSKFGFSFSLEQDTLFSGSGFFQSGGSAGGVGTAYFQLLDNTSEGIVGSESWSDDDPWDSEYSHSFSFDFSLLSGHTYTLMLFTEEDFDSTTYYDLTASFSSPIHISPDASVVPLPGAAWYFASSSLVMCLSGLRRTKKT